MAFACMNSFQRQSLLGNTNFSSTVWKKSSASSTTYNSTISNGFFTNPGLSDNTYQTLVFTKGIATLGGWTIGAGTGTSAVIANGSTSYYSGVLPTSITKQYFISTNGTSTTGNVQTLTQTLSINTPGTHYLTFYIVPGVTIDPNHTLSVYIGGVNVLKNYSPVTNGAVANGKPIAVTLPFVVPPQANSIPLILGFVFYCPNSNLSYLGVTGITEFSQSIPVSFGYPVVDPSYMSLYLPFNTDLLDQSTGISSVNYGTYNGTGTGLATSTTAPVISGSGCLALNSTNQNYLTISKTITLPSWSSTSGFTFSGWFYGLGNTQNFNATLFTLRSSTSTLTLTYYAQQPFLIFTANPWGVVCSISNYYLFSNSWNHFAVTIGGGTSAGNAIYQFYLNGTPITSTTGIWPADIYNTINIGFDTSIDASFGYFNGYIEEIRIYNRYLSLQEINALSNFVKSTPSYTYVDPTSMIMYYPMNSGTMNIMYGISNSFVVNNGLFMIPTQSGTSTNNPNVSSWKFITNNGAYYTLNGIGSTGYSFGLPSGSGTSTQYIRLTTTSIGSTVQMYQNMILLGSSPSYTTNYLLSFTAFPLDNSYNIGQYLSVSLGNMILLNQTRFISSVSTVPYTSFCIPFTTTLGKNMKLTFTTSSTVSNTSSIGITDISLVTNPTVGLGYNAIDSSAQSMYYNADTGGSTSLINFATGTSIADATITSSSMITANTTGGIGVAQIGTACLSFTSQNNQSVTLGSITVSSTGSKPGISFSGWFYPIGTQTTNSTLFSFKNTSGGSISCFYNGANNWLDFSANPGNEYIAWSYRIIPNTWNFFCYVIQYVSGSVANHTYYWNDVSMATITGAWVNTGSTYNTNYLGYSSGLGYFNGYMDDFRVYNRALSIQDVFSLWNFGYQTMGSVASTQYTNLIDSNSLQIYYPFDQGTGVTTFLPFFGVPPSYGTIGIGTITLLYGPATTYYYVSISRNKQGVSGNPIVQSIGGTSFVDISLTGITADSSYTYTITPTSQSGNTGNSYTTSIISPTSDVSISSIPFTPSKTGITLNFGSARRYYNSFYDVCFTLINVNTSTMYLPYTRITSVPGVYDYNSSFTGLTANIAYKFLMISHNAINISGGTVITTNTSPISDVSSVSYTSSATNNLGISFGSATQSYVSFYDVSISRISGGTVSGALGAVTSNTIPTTVYSYTDTSPDIYANTAYQYLLTSHNAVNISGGTVITPLLSPYPVVTFSSYTGITKTGLTTNFGTATSFYDVSISRITNSGGSARDVSGPYIGLNPGQVFYTDSTLTANLMYKYAILPYNAVNISGGLVVTPYTSPTSDVSSVSYTSSATNNLGISFGSATQSYVSFYDVSISRISGGVVSGALGAVTSNTIPTSVYSYTDTSTDISANTAYQYLLTSHNAVNISGGTVITPLLSPYPVVNFSSYTGITKTGLTVNFGTVTSFYDVSISRITNSGGNARDVSGAYIGLNPGQVFYTDSTLTANLMYKYAILPYNAVNISGGLVVTPYTSPTSDVSSVSYVSSATNTLGINFSSATQSYVSFYDVSISRIRGGTVSGVVGQVASNTIPTTTYSYTDTSPDITADTSYQYLLTSHNAVNISGGTVITPLLSPYPAVTFSSYTNLSKNGVTVNFGTGTSFYDISICRITNTVGYDVYGTYIRLPARQTTYSDQGYFSAVSNYKYAIMPYNALNNSGTVVITPSVSPISDVSYNTYASTPYTLTIYFMSASMTYLSYASITISRVSGGVVTGILGNVVSTEAYTIQYLNIIDNTGVVMYYPFEFPSTFFTDTSTDISANTAYQYLLASNNAANSAGGTVLTPLVSPSPVVTFISYTAITKTSLTVNFGTATSFYDVSISRISNIGGGATDTYGVYVSLNPGQTFYTDTMVSANLLYKYAILPYNAIGNSGGLTVTPTYTSPTSDVSFYSMVSSTSTNTIGFNFVSVSQSYVSFYDVSISRISGGVVSGYLAIQYANTSPTSVYTYTDTSTDISANTAYKYQLTSYNALNISGGTTVTQIWSPFPVVTFSSYTGINTTNITVNFGTVTSFYNVNIARITNTGGSDVYGSYNVLTPGQNTYNDTGSLFANYSYRYGLSPINAINSPGNLVITPYTSPTSDVSLSVTANGSYNNITTNSISVFWSSATRSYYSFYDVSISRVTVNTGFVAPYVMVLYTNNLGYAPYDYSYVDTGVLPNTTYQYRIVSYNAMNVSGGTVITPITCTLPYLNTVTTTFDISANISLTTSADSSYNYINIYRNNGVLYYSNQYSTSRTIVDNSNIVVNLPYTYTIVPYNLLNVTGTSNNQTFTLVPIINGFFSTPLLTSGTNTFNPSFVPSTTYGWTVGGSNTSKFYVANGTGSGLFTGVLPSTCTQYFISVGGSGTQTLSQSFPVPTAGNYYITFFVFAGSNIDNGHTLSVSIGSTKFLYNYSLGSIPNTKPIPITFLYTAVSGALYLPIVFTFTSSNTNLSYYGITGIQCFGQNTPSSAYTIVDPLSMSHYYSFVTDISNYATGTTAIADTVTIGTSRVTSANSPIVLLNNQPALSMTPTSYITSSTTTSVPTWSSTAGFSLSGWFYGAGTQATDASLVTLTLGSSTMWLTYKTTNILAFTGTNGGTSLPSLASKVMYPNTWNHLAVSISGGTVSSANASYSLYINGWNVSNSTGTWPTVGAYSVKIGNSAVGGGFNGYMNELRIYQRAISPIELQMLWNMGMTTSAYTIIDPSAMIMYYPVNMGGIY